ncbi:MAG: nuclear transport factor 2 family protein [Rhodobacteraceae bacterium]|nr:nuclear transport factor 2 family protein [Paracoccaceae bacterium]
MSDATADRLAKMVETYFRGVDTRDMKLILSVLGEDCRFTVESHGDTVTGHDGIRAMFEHIWESPGSVRHHDFVHTVDRRAGRIASQFQVTYEFADGRIVHKSNCNVFALNGETFGRVQVYMAGDNRLKIPPAG